MSELDKLVDIGQLKREPLSAGEDLGLIRSGEARLADARKGDLSLESRFDLAYNAGSQAPAGGGDARADSRFFTVARTP